MHPSVIDTVKTLLRGAGHGDCTFHVEHDVTSDELVIAARPTAMLARGSLRPLDRWSLTVLTDAAEHGELITFVRREATKLRAKLRAQVRREVRVERRRRVAALGPLPGQLAEAFATDGYAMATLDDLEAIFQKDGVDNER